MCVGCSKTSEQLNAKSMAMDASSLDATWSDGTTYATTLCSNGSSHGHTYPNDGQAKPLDDGAAYAVDDGAAIPRPMDASATTYRTRCRNPR